MRVNFGEWLPDQPGVAGALVDAKNVIPQQVGYGPLPAPAEWSNAAAETLNSVVAASAPSEAVTVFAGGSTKLFKLETNLSLSNVSKAGNYVTPSGRKVNTSFKKRLEALNLKGLGFEQTTQRFYPEGSSSAQLTGFIGSDIYGEETGYFGLEGSYNGELKGRKGYSSHEKDASGLPILIGKFISKEPKSGKTLILNIDRTVQHVVEEKLKRDVVKYGAKNGSVIVMDPQTGNILAMASYPGYDQAFAKFYPFDNYKNPITADTYEPGSTFKVLVMAAGVNEGLVTPETVCDICAGPLNMAGFTIRT